MSNTANNKKEILLRMARDGEKRPNRNNKDPDKKQLGNALISYSNKSQAVYDPVFDAKIRRLAPKWFENTANKKKAQLLEMAKSGEKRPSQHSKNPEERRLRNALISYTYKSSDTYDPVFDAEIRRLRPDWFRVAASKKKAQLLEMARSGEKKPSQHSKNPEERRLRNALANYICKYSSTYDPVFDAEIRRLAPKWFENTANNKKEILFRMARDGEKRPNRNNKDPDKRRLRNALYNYIHKFGNAYDPIFDAEIHRLRPDWFESTTSKKKAQLLRMARDGEKRPNRNNKDLEEKQLGNALISYSNKSQAVYDPVFDAEIRRLRPDWFRVAASKKKAQLLEMARSGEKRPNGNNKDPEERRLGRALSCYTNKCINTYDPVFDAEIRRLRPDWFKNTATIKKEQLLEMARNGKKRPSKHSKDLEEKQLGKALINYVGVGVGIRAGCGMKCSSALVLDSIARYFDWPSSSTDEWGWCIACGVFGLSVFYVSHDDGVVNASCVLSSGSLTPKNDFRVYASDPDLFDQLEDWFRSWDDPSTSATIRASQK